jgi:prepilin-type N-terminal cleavage/methylation domain-containing protein
MSMSQRLHREDAGFTLVELLVVIVLLGVVGTIMTSGVVSAFRANAHAETRIQALTAMQSTLANVSREIRSADSRETQQRVLLQASPTVIEFDSFRDGRRSRFTYTVVGTTLTERRRVWTNPAFSAVATTPQQDSTRTIIRDLTGHTGPAGRRVFRYRDAAGTCISGCPGNLDTILVAGSGLGQVVEVTIELQRPMQQGRPNLSVVTAVTLRNA